MITRWIPIATLGTIGYTQSQEVRDMVEVPITMTKIAGTQLELSSLRKAIMSDQITGDLPRTFPRGLSKYIQSRMTSSTGRDTSNDLWGTPYNCHRERLEYKLWSSGPDLDSRSDDDIIVRIAIQ